MFLSDDGEWLFSLCPWLDGPRIALCDAVNLEPAKPVGPGRVLVRQFDRVLGVTPTGFLWVLVRNSVFDSRPCLSVRTRTRALREVFRLPFTLDEEEAELPPEYFGTGELYWVGRYGGQWQTFILTPAESLIASYPCRWRSRNPRDRRQPGFSGVFAVPGREELWYAVDRTDLLLVVDARTLQEVGTLKVPRQGCRQILFSPEGMAFIQNFDTVVVVDTKSREIVNENRLQVAQWDEQGRKFAAFIGEMLLHPDGERLFVARPFSGDVLVVEVRTLEKLEALPVEGEPLELVLHPNGKHLFIRDGWSGEFKQCTLD